MSVRRLLSLSLALVATGCAENPSAPTSTEPGPHFLRWEAPAKTRFDFQGRTLVRSPIAALVTQAPPVADNSSSATADATTLSWSHTVGGGPSRLLLVTVSIDDGKTVSSVTYRGTNLTRLGARSNSSAIARVEMWYLVAPVSGTGSVTVKLSGEADVVAGAVSFSGVDPVTPFSGFVTAGSTGSGSKNPAVSTSSSANDLVVAALAIDGTVGSFTPAIGTTERWRRISSDQDIAGAVLTASGATPNALSWTTSTAKIWAMAGAAIKPAPTLALAQYQATFWAKRGQSRSLQINYSAGGGTSPFMRLTITDPIYVPGQGNLAVGDSVLVTATVDPTSLAVSLQPHQTLFGTPAQLKIWYGGAGGDLNGDGVVDGTDAHIEAQLLGLWYQGLPTDPWAQISATQSLGEKSFTAPLQHFSQYAVAW